jgi:hypothetical protein
MTTMKIGVAIGLFWERKILLVLRDNKLGIEYPNSWDLVTEGLEDGEDPSTEKGLMEVVRRGAQEELCVVPENLKLIGRTKAGHGFAVGFPTDRERKRINIKVGGEGQAHNFFTLDRTRGLYLGGALRYRLEAYPEAFEKLIEGAIPDPRELGLEAINV